MAIGDAAAAAGLTVFPSSQDWRLGYQNDNQRGDDLANHITSGGHNLANMTGTLPQSKGGTGGTDAPSARTALGITAANTPSGTGSNVQADLNYLASTKANAGGTWTGPVNAAGSVVASADIGCVGRLQGVGSRSFTVVSSWVSAALDGSGYLGIMPSVRSAKQDISPWTMDLDTFKGLGTKTFRLKATVEADPDAPYDLGMIADDFVDAGLGELVFNDPITGDLAGLHYERLTVPLWSVVQQQQALIEQLAARVSALEEGNSNG
jgi:hypothetical protein